MWFIIQLNRDVVAINILSNLRNTKIPNKNDLKQVSVQVPTSADKVALLAFAAQCNLPAARRCCMAPGDRRCRSVSPAGTALSSKPAAEACSGQ